MGARTLAPHSPSSTYSQLDISITRLQRRQFPTLTLHITRQFQLALIVAARPKTNT
ncbi:hypothetical protein PSAC2689_80206 [Paraburkholderia sacchari]